MTLGQVDQSEDQGCPYGFRNLGAFQHFGFWLYNWTGSSYSSRRREATKTDTAQTESAPTLSFDEVFPASKHGVP